MQKKTFKFSSGTPLGNSLTSRQATLTLLQCFYKEKKVKISVKFMKLKPTVYIIFEFLEYKKFLEKILIIKIFKYKNTKLNQIRF